MMIDKVFIYMPDFSSTVEIVNQMCFYNMYCFTEEYILLVIDNTLLQLTKAA